MIEANELSEDRVGGIVKHKSKLHCFNNVHELYQYRKAYMKITQFIWIREETVIEDGELYFPQTPILITLN